MKKMVVGIVGSYRKDRVTDNAVTAVLEGAAQAGAETKKIYLVDKHIEFCDNCRACLQEKNVQGSRGKCVHKDDMEDILTEIEQADAIVLGSPINFSTVTALMKRFTERLIVYTYWPWKAKVPKMRIKQKTKKAVIVTSSACPAFIGRILMPNALSVLKAAANCIGAKVVKKFYFGLVAAEKNAGLNPKGIEKARRAGMKLFDN
ncbi:MAG: flavodoxin family protein [Planctomycetota bacterium]|jgi:NAD(P)H-dependent FMN reductase